MVFIENEGALFKGRKVNMPYEIYLFDTGKWVKYKGEVPKAFDWGQEVGRAFVDRLIKYHMLSKNL